MVYRGDMWSVEELKNFVHTNHFQPYQAVHSESELQKLKLECREELSTEAALFVSPPTRWLSSEDDRVNGLYAFSHDCRLLRK